MFGTALLLPKAELDISIQNEQLIPEAITPALAQRIER